VVFIVLVILKIAFCYSRARRQRVLVVRTRRVACVEVSVPIVENDELQREHERAEQEIPDCPPPPYSPTAEPGEIDTQNTGQNQDQTEGGGQANTSEGYGVHQGSPMAPPAYSSSPAANPNENTTQTDLIQMGGMTGNIEEMNGVPQGSAMVPPPAYSPRPAANPNENITGQNSAQPDPKTSGYQ
jgi:hypothetical protein